MELVINDRFRKRKVTFFNNFNINLKFDSVASSFNFGFYFNPDNIDHKELLCIGHYHPCILTHNDELIITGTMLSNGFTAGTKRELVNVSGYSLPGVFEDCDIPLDISLETNRLSLRQIAQRICDRFGIQMVVAPQVAADMDKLIAASIASAGTSIKAYFAQLAAQKNITITHTPAGALLFTRANTSQQPAFQFKAGMPEVTMSLSFNGQAMHSHITAVKEPDSEGGNQGEETVRNPYVINNVYRPKVVTQSSGDDIDTKQVAMNALAQELKNLSLSIQIDRWSIKKDGIIRPNTIITVINPDIYLYKESRWFVEEVTMVGNEDSATATLKCVLPEAYNGNMPEYLFKGINMHA